jgi:hypothetical protein
LSGDEHAPAVCPARGATRSGGAETGAKIDARCAKRGRKTDENADGQRDDDADADHSAIEPDLGLPWKRSRCERDDEIERPPSDQQTGESAGGRKQHALGQELSLVIIVAFRDAVSVDRDIVPSSSNVKPPVGHVQWGT